MRRGRLRELITIQSAATGQDAIGQPVTGWVDVAAGIPAEIADLSGREYLAANATQSVTQTKFIIDAIPGITAAMRVVHESGAYNIDAPLFSRDRRMLTLMCSRVAQ